MQSVAVRLVVEREREIQKFDKEEYWSIEADFLPSGAGAGKTVFPAYLHSMDGKAVGKMGIKNGDNARDIIEGLKSAKYSIADITVKEIRRNPSPPFTTSTLQQEAARKLGYSAKQTMVIAQKLYENGHITYMRTDSVNLAESALAQAHQVIGTEFGAPYQLDSPRRFSTKSKGAQEAHEAVRPTNLAATSGHDLGIKERNDQRLYDLIWKRTIASQMREALLDRPRLISWRALRTAKCSARTARPLSSTGLSAHTPKAATKALKAKSRASFQNWKRIWRSSLKH